MCVVVVWTTSLANKVWQSANIMLAIAACPDILETVRFPILALDHFSQVLGTIVGLARFVDADILSTDGPAASSQSARQLAAFPVAAELVQRSYRWTLGRLVWRGDQSWDVHRHADSR